jgi:dsRNA-specific ribonuclease
MSPPCLHLNKLFKPLQFPPELARRILTHGSHKNAVDGHNGRLSFVGMSITPTVRHELMYLKGRRVLESYLLLFLQSSPSLNPEHDYEFIVSRALSTYVLGEHVGQPWDIQRVLQWSPSVPSEQLGKITRKLSSQSKADKRCLEPDFEGTGAKREDSPPEEWLDVEALGPEVPRSVGFYKVLGEAVQAIIGGIFHQFASTLPLMPFDIWLNMTFSGWLSCTSRIPYTSSAQHPFTRTS